MKKTTHTFSFQRRFSFSNFLTLSFLLPFLMISSLWARSPIPMEDLEDKFIENEVHVALDQSLNATAIWLESDSEHSSHVVKTKTCPYFGSWSEPIVLSSSEEEASDPQILVDYDGRALISWVLKGKKNSVIQVAEKEIWDDWLPTTTISEVKTKSYATNHTLTVDKDGNLFVIWLQKRKSSHVIQVATKPLDAEWSLPKNLVVIPGTEDKNAPSIAVDYYGNAIAVWLNEAIESIQASEKPYNGDWSEPRIISGRGDIVGEPQLIFDRQCNAVASWTKNNGFNTLVQTAIKPYGKPWSTKIDTLSESWQDSANPILCKDTSGNITLTWASTVGDRLVRQMTQKPYNGSWSTPITFSEKVIDRSKVPLKGFNKKSSSAMRKKNSWHRIFENTICLFDRG